MASPRRPVRLLEKSNISSAYPKELVADFSSGELILINSSGKQVASNPLSIETTGSGNFISSITVSGRKITITKSTPAHQTIPTSTDGTSTASPDYGETFTAVDSVTRDSNGHVTKINTKTITLPALKHTTISTADDTTSTGTPGYGGTFTAVDSVTRDSNGHVTKINTKTVTLPALSHPTVNKTTDTTSTASPSHGETFTAVDSVIRDTYGHVTKINTKTVTLPSVPSVSVTNSGTGNAITSITASDHKITVTKGATFLTAHPTISTSDDSTSTASPDYGETFTAVDSVIRDDNGHVTKINTKTITLPNAPIVIEQNKGLEQKFWRGTQAEYDVLTTKDDATMYIITDTDGEVTIGDMLTSVYDPQGKAQDIFAYVDTAIGNAIGGSY